MKYLYREVSRTDLFTPARDKGPKSNPSVITAVAVLMDKSRYTGADLRGIRAEKGVGRPPKIKGTYEQVLKRSR